MRYGEVQQAKFGLLGKQAHMFSCGDNGLVLERESGGICLYATDSSHQKILCAIPLGSAKALKGANYYIFAHSPRYMLMGVGKALFVVDFEEHFCATNLEGLKVFGSDHWGQDVTGVWKDAYLPLFGIPNPKADMNESAAKDFWLWFGAEQSRIISMAGAGGRDGVAIVNELDQHLTPVFPYERGDNIQFQLGCNGGVNEFFFYHHGNERLMQDGEKLKAMMPSELAENWNFFLQQ